MTDIPTGGAAGPDSAEQQRLLEAVALAGRPVPVAVGTQITGWTETELLAAGDRLTAEGRLAQTAEGLLPASPEAASAIVAEIGALRLATVMGSLADAFAAGNAGPEVVGPYLAGAARWEEAVRPLSEAGLDAVEQRHLAEALPLLDQALEAVEHVRMDDHELRARLHLGRARCYRMVGQSEAAVADATHAIRLSEGPALVDALEWRSRLADDRQHSQDADGYLAAAQLAAIDDPGRLGQLHSFRARTLGRIGFPLEAEASLEKAHTLLAEHGTDAERWQARYDEAWVAFDQGRAQDAADRFAALAGSLEDHQEAELADIEMWEVRALFAAGSPTKALEVHSRAMARAEEIGAFGPVFLGHMALTEGAALYGAWEQSLESADATLTIVLESLPAWENAARFLRAQALTGLKRYDEAKTEISAAIAASPEGINGWRWRNRCMALQWRIVKLAGGKWDDLKPADLTEELLAGRFYLPAVELMADRVRFEKDPELATSTAALALRVGLPLHAARALAGTDRWVGPEGVATAHRIKQIQVPEPWQDGWNAVPGVAPALAVQEGGDPTEAVQTLQADLDAAFESAGLHIDDRRLSPAQRSASGLRIKQPRQPRRRRRLASLASAAALVLVAGVAGGVVATVFNSPDTVFITTVETVVPGPDQPEPTTVEETQLAIPDITGFGAAQWSFRGETDREGFNGDRDGKSTRSGVDDLKGYWWKFNTNQPVDGSPVVRGSSVMIGSGSETFYVFDATTGNQLWTRDVDGPISSSASFAFAPLGEGGENESVVFVGTENGTVQGWRTRTGAPLWTQSGAGPITAPLLVADANVYAPSEDGYIYAYQAAPPGTLSWRFPAEGSDALAAFTTAPLYVDGNLIAVTETGTYVMVNGATGEEVCRRDLGKPVNAAPTYVENSVYVGSPGAITILRPANCAVSGEHLFEQFLPMYASPLVDGRYVYVTSGTSILKFDLLTSLFDWRFVTRATIRSSPALSGGILYFGADNGLVYALDADTGEEIWSFQTGGEVRSSPAIADGAIYIGSRDGSIYALGGTSDEG